MEPKAFFVATPAGASGSLEVTQENEYVAIGALVVVGVKFGEQRVPLTTHTHLGWSKHCDTRHETRGVLQLYLHCYHFFYLLFVFVRVKLWPR